MYLPKWSTIPTLLGLTTRRLLVATFGTWTRVSSWTLIAQTSSTLQCSVKTIRIPAPSCSCSCRCLYNQNYLLGRPQQKRLPAFSQRPPFLVIGGVGRLLHLYKLYFCDWSSFRSNGLFRKRRTDREHGLKIMSLHEYFRRAKNIKSRRKAISDTTRTNSDRVEHPWPIPLSVSIHAFCNMTLSVLKNTRTLQKETCIPMSNKVIHFRKVSTIYFTEVDMLYLLFIFLRFVAFEKEIHVFMF